MANFKEAFDITMGHEGVYSNDPKDAGGETYRGISRKYHPYWEGWRLIDTFKTKKGWDKDERNFTALDTYVREFYRETFWTPMLLDRVPQIVANELFDTGVNMGIARAGSFLQRSLNVLNRDGVLFDDLVEDGQVGGKTLDALSQLSDSDLYILVLFMNVCQGQHYMDYMKKSPTQEKYARGWAKRITLEKRRTS